MVIENSIEQCCAANNVQSCQQFLFNIAIVPPDSASRIFSNIVDNNIKSTYIL